MSKLPLHTFRPGDLVRVVTSGAIGIVEDHGFITRVSVRFSDGKWGNVAPHALQRLMRVQGKAIGQ